MSRLQRQSYPVGFQFAWAGVRVWKDHEGWFFDGPASYGPRHVRRSGRGPYWCGPISPAFAGCLLARMRRRIERGA